MTVINPGSDAATGGWAPYLDPGEKILWEGTPSAGIRARSADIAISVFGIFFFGFAVFWVYMASSMGRGGPSEGGMDVFATVFPLFGLPFIAVGFYMLIGQYFWKAYVRSKTRYALTTKRAIIAKSAVGRHLKSYPINGDTRLEYEPGEASTIWFAEEIRRGNKGRSDMVKKGFEFITRGDELYRLMRQVQQGEAA